MKSIFRQLIPAAALLLLTCRAEAQRFLWDVDFFFRFDNQEYAGMENVPSQTVFAAHIDPKVGLGFGDAHALYLGGNFGRYFGKATAPKYDAEMLLYYQYAGEHLFVDAGAFPAENFAGYYFPAICSDRFLFDHVTEGALLRYGRKSWMLEAAVDWTGMLDKEIRESFFVYSYGKYEHEHFPYLNVAYTYVMHHFAGSETVRGVVDNIWLYPHVGFNLAPLTPLKKLGGKVGWLNTFQNDRIAETGFVCPGGFQMELELEYWGFGLNDILYAGPGLMPFYDSVDAAGVPYGDRLYFSDNFYRTDHGLYNRLEVYWNWHLNDLLSVRISSVHHCDGKDWGWQQLIALQVDLNRAQFPMHRKTRKR